MPPTPSPPIWHDGVAGMWILIKVEDPLRQQRILRTQCVRTTDCPGATTVHMSRAAAQLMIL